MTLSTAQVDKIRALAAEGKTATEIARATGRGVTGIDYICRRYQIELRTRTGRVRHTTSWSAERRATHERIKADPERWGRYIDSLRRNCSGGGEISPKPCAPGAWEAVLIGREFDDVPVRAASGRIYRVVLETGTGRSSMACA